MIQIRACSGSIVITLHLKFTIINLISNLACAFMQRNFLYGLLMVIHSSLLNNSIKPLLIAAMEQEIWLSFSKMTVSSFNPG
jgi:hypothetical protein